MPTSKDTNWLGIVYTAQVPLNTTLVVHARTSADGVNWGAWSPDYMMSPADLFNNMALPGNLHNDGYLQVEFEFATMAKNASPKLQDFSIVYECPGVIG